MMSRLGYVMAACMLAAFGLVLGTGCGPDGNAVSTLQQFKTCDGLLDYIKERAKQEARERYTSSSNWGGIGFVPMASDATNTSSRGGTAAEKQSTNPSSSTPTDYSRTNNQVAGVDEADIIKNDGKYLYVLNRSYFLIVKAWPANEIKLLAKYTLTGSPREMFVHKDKVVIFSTDTGSGSKLSSGTSRGVYASTTRMTILDIADRTAPKLLRVIDTEGEYKTSRRVGETVRAVLYTRINLPTNNAPYKSGTTPWENDRLRDERTNKHLKQIGKTQLRDWLPVMRDMRFANGQESARKDAVLSNCSSFYRPSVHSGRGIVTVFSLQMDKPQTDLAHASLVSNYGHTYSSASMLYVATAPVFASNSTHIHAFDIQTAGKPALYKASGRVDGEILNQFAMDEYKGHLRVATTSREAFGTESNIFVLKQSGTSLAQVGALRGLARGERIYSARFVQDRGYIVTFRQIDPLFTLDLSVPSAPKQVGELKIPGYSTYIHPLDRNHLLTVGVDGTNDGLNGKIQLAIFDVTDFANPKQAHKVSLQADHWSASSQAALYDHKAFNYFASKKVLAIPLSSIDYTGKTYGNAGVQLFKIDIAKGITKYGSVSHEDLYKNLGAPKNVPEDDFRSPNSSAAYSNMGMRRSAFIEDYFYSISMAGIKVHRLGSFEKHISLVGFPL